MSDAELVEQIVEDAIDKIWLPFEFKFIEWAAEYKAKYVENSWYENEQREFLKELKTVHHYKNKLK